MSSSVIQSIKTLVRERNGWMVGFYVMLVAFFIVFVAYINKDTKFEVTIPPNLDTSFSAMGDVISSSYQKKMALWIVGLMYTKTAKSQRGNHVLIIEHASPNYESNLWHKLNSSEKKYKQKGLSTVFYPKETKVYLSKNEVRVTGELRALIGDRMVSKNKMAIDVGFGRVNGAWKLIKLVGVREDAK